MLSLFFPAIIGCCVTFITGALIILTQRWHGRWSFDYVDGVQKFHTMPTPRVGGLAILLGSFTSIYIFNPELNAMGRILLLAGIPPFLIGFIEDITKRVSVRVRLFAIVVGTFIGIICTEIYLNRLDIFMLDDLVSFWPLGVLVTVIAISGVTNSINILDGFNGLASGTAAIIILIFACLSYQVKDMDLFILCATLFGIIFGFLLLNYPFGKIFMGDAGAYLVGFLVAWIGLLLPMRNEDVSPWASLLICSYPVTEVIYSICRRIGAKLSPSQADSDHLHSLIKKNLISPHFGFLSTWAKNSMVAPTVWFSTICTGFVAFYYSNNVTILVLAYIAFVIWYHVTYIFLTSKNNK